MQNEAGYHTTAGGPIVERKCAASYSPDGRLNANVMDAIMTEEKQEVEKIALHGDRLKKYFPNYFKDKKSLAESLSFLSVGSKPVIRNEKDKNRNLRAGIVIPTRSKVY